MISRIPIYQMTFGQDSEGKPGLVFASEQAEYENQSVLFTIPILDNIQYPIEFIDYFEDSTIIFPFQLEGEYYELKGKINFPEITFEIPKTDFKITFEIDNDNMFSWQVFPFRRRPYLNMKYVGKQTSLILKNHSFLILHPVDLYEMDELYFKHKGIFVGQTPNFGNFDNLDRWQNSI
jgi:hypothetical protein